MTGLDPGLLSLVSEPSFTKNPAKATYARIPPPSIPNQIPLSHFPVPTPIPAMLSPCPLAMNPQSLLPHLKWSSALYWHEICLAIFSKRPVLFDFDTGQMPNQAEDGEGHREWGERACFEGGVARLVAGRGQEGVIRTHHRRLPRGAAAMWNP